MVKKIGKIDGKIVYLDSNQNKETFIFGNKESMLQHYEDVSFLIMGTTDLEFCERALRKIKRNYPPKKRFLLIEKV